MGFDFDDIKTYWDTKIENKIKEIKKNIFNIISNTIIMETYFSLLGEKDRDNFKYLKDYFKSISLDFNLIEAQKVFEKYININTPLIKEIKKNINDTFLNILELIAQKTISELNFIDEKNGNDIIEIKSILFNIVDQKPPLYNNLENKFDTTHIKLYSNKYYEYFLFAEIIKLSLKYLIVILYDDKFEINKKIKINNDSVYGNLKDLNKDEWIK